MKIYIKFNINTICNRVLEDELKNQDVKHNIVSFGEVEFPEGISAEKLSAISTYLNGYGAEIIENPKNALVQKIKDTIREMVFSEGGVNVKASIYISEKLKLSYGYLSNLFSEVTYTSIENFIILQKIEYAKHLILNNKLSLTEIADRLNYSSVAHLSTQFKNTTGLTPSQFQKIIGKRREMKINN